MMAHGSREVVNNLFIFYGGTPSRTLRMREV